MEWTWIDGLLAGIVVLSTIISLIRGFTREVLSLVTWIVAIWVAASFTSTVAEFFKEEITSTQLRVIMTFAGLFIATLLMGSLLNYLISRLIVSTGLSGTDRLLGSLFGIVRGVVVGVLLIVVAGFTPLVKHSTWQNTQLIPIYQPITAWLLTFLPTEGTVAWLVDSRALLTDHPFKKQPHSMQKSDDRTKSNTPSAGTAKKAIKSLFPDRPILEVKARG